MAKGWFNQSLRHARAARGEKSAKDQTPAGMASASPKNRVLNKAMQGKLEEPPRPPWEQKYLEYPPEDKRRHETLRNKLGLTKRYYYSGIPPKHQKELDRMDSAAKKRLEKADFDKDGVQDNKDCEPLNPKKQGKEHDLAMQREIIKKPFSERTSEENGLLNQDLTAEVQKRDSVASVVPERRDPKTREEPDRSTFGFLEEQKFKAKSAIPFVKTTPQEEAKELRTLRKRVIKREGDQLRRQEIRDLEKREELGPLEERNLRLKKDLHNIRTEKENERLQKQIEAEGGGGFLSDLLGTAKKEVLPPATPKKAERGFLGEMIFD